jgi:hypothetical protein
MKIINNRTFKEKTFEDLQIGDVYIDGDGDVCIKINTINGDNAVMLENGVIICTDSNAIVIPVKATLLLKRNEWAI